MAYLYIHPVYGQSSKTIDYIKNPDKTEDKRSPADEQLLVEGAISETLNYVTREDAQLDEKQYFVTGINCDPDDAANEFSYVRRIFGSKGNIVCHHGWQSFPPDLDLTPEQVHKMGVEFAENAFGDRFQVVVTTHLDRNHLHNHFAINATSFVDGKKFYGNKATMRKLRRISDALCIKYNLPVIENPNYYGVNRGSYHARKRGAASWRDMLKMDIDDAITLSHTYDGFIAALKDKGYLIKFGKHIAVSPPEFYKKDPKTGEKKRAYLRLDTLRDDRYTVEGITRRINGFSIQKVHTARPKRYIKRVKKKGKLPRTMARHYAMMYRLGFLKKKPRRRLSAFQVQKRQKEARVLSRQIVYMNERKLFDIEDLMDRYEDVKGSIRELSAERQRIYRTQSKEGEDEQDRLSEISENLKPLREEERILSGILRVGAKDNEKQRQHPRYVGEEQIKKSDQAARRQ